MRTILLFVTLLFLAALVTIAWVQRRHVQRKERERAHKREVEQEKRHAREVAAMNERLREHESQLEEAIARLLELDAQKSRFFANVSHEFRTPLTLLIGPLRDHLEGYVDNERLGVQAPMMHRNAQRLLGLINQLLDLSNLEAGAMQLNPRRLDLVSFLREIVMAFSARAEREGISLSFSARPASLPANFDPDKLEKVASNLLSNAFKFTPKGGKIRVSAAASSDDDVDIFVKDTGRGIPEEELPHIFDRFYQVDASSVREHDGTGIGLALAKELVSLHDGTIEVESEVGFGTTFTIRLPIRLEAEDLEAVAPTITSFEADASATAGADEAPGAAATAIEHGDCDGESASGNGAITSEAAPLVLIVEDNPDMRTYLKSHLQARYRVIECEDGEEGLERAKACRPDLVLADVMMPKMDGYSLCRTLKSDPSLGDVPVVLLTAKTDQESRLVGLEIGADDYLEKPFSAEELLARMENLIELRRRLRDRYGEAIRLGPSQVTVSSEEASFVREVREVIEKNMEESRFGVGELAEEVGFSRRQLQRRLKAAADLSAGAYIRMMRLERAAQLLEQDAGLVSEVAYRVGFKNADHFSRLFRQVFGVPPSEYPLASQSDPA